MIIFSAKTPLRGQSLDNFDVVFYEDSIRSVHLTRVSMDNRHTYFDTKGRMDIRFSYTSYVAHKNIKKVEPEDDITSGRSYRYRTEVRFLPTDTKGVYKIEKKEHEIGSRSQPHGWGFIGYSSDTTFFDVKVYNYYLQHAPVYKVYKPKKLDEKPYFGADSIKTDFKDYVSEQMIKRHYSYITDNLRGSVTVSFVINSFSGIVDFQVDRLKLKPKNEFIRINGNRDMDFEEQINIFLVALNQSIVDRNYYPRYHNWTPGKINGEAVASIQYLTFEFK
ncbi:MAG: hypothetical protein LUG18_02620 [Candidatus Azobacteroides sp.]|nr:hypothetical protein [Candidatus Azobacteroides sp.]